MHAGIFEQKTFIFLYKIYSLAYSGSSLKWRESQPTSTSTSTFNKVGKCLRAITPTMKTVACCISALFWSRDINWQNLIKFVSLPSPLNCSSFFLHIWCVM